MSEKPANTARLTVTVAVDLDAACVTVRPAGTLTSENVRGLLAVVHRAERTLPGFSVHLELEHLLAQSRSAIDHLRDSGAVVLPQQGHSPSHLHAA